MQITYLNKMQMVTMNMIVLKILHSLIKIQKEFTVYKVPGSSKDPIDLQQGSKHGSFFPFNTLGDHKYWGIPQISEKSPDFHFGMTMSAKFIQPKDGKN